jgi:putative transposase
VGTILKAHGLEPAPDRKRQSTWKTFLKAHWDTMAAIDFATVEVWSKKGLVTFYLLFVMEVATRRVCFAGCTPSPDGDWMKQMARNLTDAEDGFLEAKRYVLMDRDSKFSVAFRQILQDAGTEPVLLPPRSPNLNAHLERFHLSLEAPLDWGSARNALHDVAVFAAVAARRHADGPVADVPMKLERNWRRNLSVALRVN